MKLKVKNLKKRLNRLLLCGLIVCALAVPAGLANGEDAAAPIPETQPPATAVPTQAPVQETVPDPTQAASVELTQEPSADPTQEASTEPTQEPSADPTQEASTEPTQEPSVEPTQEASTEPTQEPSAEPTQEASAEPTQEPSIEPTQEPGVEPTPEPTLDPGASPSADPSMEPTLDPSLEPTLDPSLEPTLDPSLEPTVSPEASIEPRPTPGSNGGLVNITPEGTAQQENGVWRIQPTAPDSPISFGWTVSGEAVNYLVYTQSGQDVPVFIAETQQLRIDLSTAGYMNGQYTLYVGAYLADGSITWGSTAFELAAQQGGPPSGGFPGGFTGGGGGRPGGMGSMDGFAQEEQGFSVTPGEALTRKHSSGTKNTAAYTHSEIAASGEAVTALALSSTQTEITLDSGAAFIAETENGVLHLRPESDGETWMLNALAMKTMAESGVESVVFHVGDGEYTLPTQMQFSGSVYASLRAKGYVSKDMEIRVDAMGVRVHIAGGIYQINENGELMPCEE